MTNSPEKKIENVAVIGVGSAGRRHALALRKESPDLNIGILDTNQETAEDVADEVRGTVFKSVEEIIALGNIDLVHVCTPDHLHTEIVARFLEAGIHVLVEKPFTTSLKDAQYLQKVAEKAKENTGAELFIGHNYRFEKPFLLLKQMIEDGEITNIVTAYATYLHDMRGYRALTPWRENQDFLFGGGTHPIDLLIFLFGEVESVSAKLGENKDEFNNMDQDFMIDIVFKSGISTHVWLNSNEDSDPTALNPDQPRGVARKLHGTDLVVVGTDKTGEPASFVAHNKEAHVTRRKRNKKALREENRQTQRKLKTGQQFTYNAEIKTVLDYLEGNQEDRGVLPSVEEATYVIRVLDAITKAITSGQEVKVL